MTATAPKECDICKRDLRRSPHFYDARMHDRSSWAWMCRTCFLAYGIGVGVGLGQEYDSETNEKVRG